MEHLLLFCCKSCLKGEGDNKEYYELLGFEDRKHATSDAIKKAYKKRSLELHPDRLLQRGIEVTPEHNMRFQKMKEAYDVLSDPRKRRIYDQIGASGLKLLDSPQEVNPVELIKNFQKNRADRVKIALTVIVFFAALLIFPILFCLKCDGDIDNAPWTAIWTPMWLINGLMLMTAFLVFTEKDDDVPEDEEGNPEKPENIPLSEKIFYFGKTICFVLLQVFILMRLDDDISWNWFRIFIPWFLYEMFTLLETGTVAFSSLVKPEPVAGNEATPEESIMQQIMIETEYFSKCMLRVLARKSLAKSLLRVWQALFLAAQLNGDVDWDWGLVLLPVWLHFAIELAHGYFMRQWSGEVLEGIDLSALDEQHPENLDPMTMFKLQQSQELSAGGGVGCCMQVIPLFMALTLVSRLEVSSFSTFIILIPVFAILGCCFCGVSCGLCGLACIDPDKLNEDADSETSNDPMLHKKADYVPPQPEDIEAQGAPVYGTFDESDSKPAATPQLPPVVVQEPVSETKIDVDID